MAASNILTGALGKLFAIAEAYPELKATHQFPPDAGRVVAHGEQHRLLAQNYNDSVLRFNNAIQVFPAKLFAGGRTTKVMLAVPEASEGCPQVQF